MDRETAFDLSTFLAGFESEGRGAGVHHAINYTPQYGYVVRIRDEEMNEDGRAKAIREGANRITDRKPVHGVEYR